MNDDNVPRHGQPDEDEPAPVAPGADGHNLLTCSPVGQRPAPERRGLPRRSSLDEAERHAFDAVHFGPRIAAITAAWRRRPRRRRRP